MNAGAILTLRAQEFFRVRFTVPSGVGRDVLLLTYLGLSSSGFGSSAIVHRLYDGTTLLGTQNTADTAVFWKSPESPFGTPGDTTYGFSGPATSVNFDSIASGTMAGRVELAVTSGEVRILEADRAEVVLIGPVRGTFPETRAPITAREWCR